MPNSAPSRGISLQNLSDPEFVLSRSLKVNSYDAVGLFILIVTMPISHGLGIIAACKYFLPCGIPGAKIRTDFHSYRGGDFVFCQSPMVSSLCQREFLHQNELDWLNRF